MNLSYRKRIRLPLAAYNTSGRVVSVTIATRRRAPIFTDLPFSKVCLAILRDLSLASKVPVFAYCMMPDHIHLLLGASGERSINQFVGAWKSQCYRERRQMGLGGRLWQRSFHDHVLRSDEDLRRVAQYILENPIRSGLAANIGEYPLSGSFEWDL